MLGLAGDRARVAADALAQIDRETVVGDAGGDYSMRVLTTWAHSSAATESLSDSGSVSCTRHSNRFLVSFVFLCVSPLPRPPPPRPLRGVVRRERYRTR